MVRILLLFSAAVLSACDQGADVAPAQPKVEIARLPFDHSTKFLDGYSLRVAREGSLDWNGAPVSDDLMKSYLHQWSQLPHAAGGLFVAIQPGALPSRAGWVRQQVIDSGLCEQHRCWEVGWDAKRPVVN